MTHEQISDVISQCTNRTVPKTQSIFAFCGFTISDTTEISPTLQSWDITDRDSVSWRVFTGPDSASMPPDERVQELNGEP